MIRRQIKTLIVDLEVDTLTKLLAQIRQSPFLGLFMLLWIFDDLFEMFEFYDYVVINWD